VYHGLNPKINGNGMVSAPKKNRMVRILILIDPNLINKDEKGVLSQYFLLKNALKKYANRTKRRLENNNYQ
jgi:hypothetical protein